MSEIQLRRKMNARTNASSKRDQDLTRQLDEKQKALEDAIKMLKDLVWNKSFFRRLERKGNYMRDSHKELAIKTAIQEYKNSVLFGFSSSTAHAINMMEEAYYMCSAYNIKGIAELKETIKEAKEKYKKELGN